MHLLRLVFVVFIFYHGCISVSGSPVERVKTVIETMELVVNTLAKKAVDELDKVDEMDCNGDGNGNDGDGDDGNDGDDDDGGDGDDILPDHKDYEDCSQIQQSVKHELKNGVYTIIPKLWGKPVDVYCDFKTADGGWTLFQRRDNYPVQENFYRNWTDYQNGFGNVTRDFWIGNDIIHALTNNKKMKLRIDLEDWESNVAYAEYSNFYFEGPAEKYKLRFDKYNGNAGDSLDYSKGQGFATHDADHNSCARDHKGAWWHRRSCAYSNLNGVYNGSTSSETGVTWWNWKIDSASLKRSEMKIRPMELSMTHSKKDGCKVDSDN